MNWANEKVKYYKNIFKNNYQYEGNWKDNLQNGIGT